MSEKPPGNFKRSPLGTLFEAIASRNTSAALRSLAEFPALARQTVEAGATRAEPGAFFFKEIAHRSRSH